MGYVTCHCQVFNRAAFYSTEQTGTPEFARNVQAGNGVAAAVKCALVVNLRDRADLSISGNINTVKPNDRDTAKSVGFVRIIQCVHDAYSKDIAGRENTVCFRKLL